MANQNLTGHSKYSVTITVDKSSSGIELRPFQEKAIERMSEKIKVRDFAGILVLPTGAGKTLTSAYWIAQNILDKGGKVLWIAHRHELLDQAYNTFERLCHSDVFRSKNELKVQLLSGVHDKPIQVDSNRDIIISSIDSLNREQGFKNLLDRWLSYINSSLLLVIDEAHHSTAQSYRKLMDNLRNNIGKFQLLGLTATPYRTAEKEKGLLKKIYKDDIIYSIDLKTLVDQGWLSDPIFETLKTDADFSTTLTDSDKEKLKKGFDIDSIGDKTASNIASNSKRNLFIAETYLRNREKYKQTIIFAINQDNAIAINNTIKNLAKEKNITDVHCDYIISASERGVSGNSKENEIKIKDFRNGNINVISNVSILTEGTDLPDTQTIFLTRPTHSKILLTQMIGRGLRGGSKVSKGTQSAYIVSFVDEWGVDFGWESPEKLYIEDNADFLNSSSPDRKKLVRLIAINKIEEFSSRCNSLNQELLSPELKWIDQTNFFQIIPVGFYFFSYFDESDNEKSGEILVYENLKQSYEKLMKDLPSLLNQDDLEIVENIEHISSMIESEYFGDTRFPAYTSSDIVALIKFYVQNKVVPDFIDFEERELFNLDKFVEENIIELDSIKERNNRISDEWENNRDKWQALFGFDNKKIFRNRIQKIIDRLDNPEDYNQETISPNVSYEEREYEKMSFDQLREQDPQYYNSLRKKVIDKHKVVRNGKTYYKSAISGYEDDNLSRFEVDHIIPFENGGLTKLDNLRLITLEENRNRHWKGNNESNVINASKNTEKSEKSDLRVSKEDISDSDYEEASVLLESENAIEINEFDDSLSFSIRHPNRMGKANQFK
jgi:superfamily II DNA or RNA helicase